MEENKTVVKKYLTVQILGSVRVNCFRNELMDKSNRQPDFLGNGVAVWINDKKEILEELKEEFI